ncbi:OmpA family protein [Mesorhizobium sp. ANAO-SY3R2]|uniref:OmpA family protein n=1 Tax=Mesorhizobium sp. ANAO-SY3R2 TaxID=3166644 RepID=UPI00366B0426
MKRQPRILAGTAIGLFMASAPLGAMPLPDSLSQTGSTPLVRVQAECQEGESAEACAARLGGGQQQEQPRRKNKQQAEEAAPQEQPAAEPQAERPSRKNKRQAVEEAAPQEQVAPEPQAEQPSRKNRRQAIEQAAPQEQAAPEPQAERPSRKNKHQAEEAAPQEQPAAEPQAEQPRRKNKRQAIEEAAPQEQPAPEPQAERPSRKNKRQAVEEAAPQEQPAAEPQAEQPRAKNKRQAVEEAAPQEQPAAEPQAERPSRKNKRQAIEETAPQEQPTVEPQAEQPRRKNKDKAPVQEALPEVQPVPTPEAAPLPQAEKPAEQPAEKPALPTPEQVPTPAPSPETTTPAGEAPSGEAPAAGAPTQGEQPAVGEQPAKPGKPGRPGKKPSEQPATGEQQPAAGEQPAQQPATGEQPAQQPVTGEQPAAGEQPGQRPSEPGRKPVLQGEAPVNPNEAPLLDSEKDAAPAEAGDKPARGERPARPGKGDKGGDQGGEQVRPRPAPVDQGPPPVDDRAATEAAQPIDVQPVTAERGKRRDRAPNEDIRRRPRPEGTEVLREFGDRLIIQINNQVMVESNERPRMTRNAQEVYYEDLPRGRTREVIVRDNGNQIITIRNRYGDIVRRSRITPDGREYVLSYVDDRHYEDMDQWRDPGLDLPPMQLRIPRNEYILDAQYVEDPEAYYDFLEQPPVERVQRLYSVDEVKRSARVRDIARRVDLDTLNFEFASASISEGEIAKLEGVANAMEKLLAKNPAETFLIEGHTDAVGSDLANLALSDRRAESVADALTNVFGIPPENLTTQGYGERYLKVKTQKQERENRRVAIRRITPLVAPVASAR